jgi:hyperosmotically inducible protein
MKSISLRGAVFAASATFLAAIAAAPASADTPQMQQGYGAQQSSGQMQQGAGQISDDTTITKNVQSAFSQDQQVNAPAIQVSTDNGVVQLSGFANSAKEASHAEEVARQVPGVKDVKNSIEVKQSPQQ